MVLPIQGDVDRGGMAKGRSYCTGERGEGERGIRVREGLKSRCLLRKKKKSSAGRGKRLPQSRGQRREGEGKCCGEKLINKALKSRSKTAQFLVKESYGASSRGLGVEGEELRGEVSQLLYSL